MDDQNKSGREQSDASEIPEKKFLPAGAKEEQKKTIRPQPSSQQTPQQNPGEQNNPPRQLPKISLKPPVAPEREEDSQKELPKSGSWIVRPLRTYKSDLAEAIRRGHASLVSIAASESKRRETKRKAVPAPSVPSAPSVPQAHHEIEKKRTPEPQTHTQPTATAQPIPLPKKVKKKRDYSRQIKIASIVLFAFGLATIVFFSFVYQRQQGKVQPVFNIPELVFTDKQREIPVERIERGNTRIKLTDEKKEVGVSLGSIEMFYFTRETAAGKFLIRASEFLELIEARAPAALIRSLNDEFTFGIHAIRNNEPFIILKLRSYDIAFASMLEWEINMNENLSPLFGPIVQPMQRLRPPQASVFQDMVISNKDVRALIDEQGNIALLYSFPDRETLILTTNAQTFAEIFTRLTSSRVQR